MKEILVKNQAELDKIRVVNFDETLTIESESELTLNFKIAVYGKLINKTKLFCSYFNNKVLECFGATAAIENYGNAIVINFGTATVINSGTATATIENSGNGTATIKNYGNATVINFGNATATIKNYGNGTVKNSGNGTATIENFGNATATIENSGNTTVINYDNGTATIKNSGNATVINYDNWTATIENFGNATATIKNSGNATVINYDNGTATIENFDNGTATIESSGNATVKILKNLSKLILNLKDFSIGILSSNIKVKVKVKKSKTATLIKQKQLNYFQKYNIKIIKGKCVLYKKVSSDFKTQENTINETLWEIGKTITHKNWNPTESECGEGKFHACATPHFCNEFRNNFGDRYIAISVKIADTYEWKNGNYPTKIAFREGKVLYECDINGKKIINKEVK